MATTKNIDSQSIVIIAQSIRPNLVDRYWLAKNGILHESEILEGSIFTPDFVQIVTSNFKLIMLKDQIQIVSLNFDFDLSDFAYKFIPAVNSLFGDAGWLAMGFNFTYFIVDGSSNINELSRKLFYNEGSKIHAKFNKDDSRFGAYLSMNVLESRLRVNITPIITDGRIQSPAGERIEFSSNFHMDFINVESAGEALIRNLSMWRNYKDEINSILDTI